MISKGPWTLGQYFGKSEGIGVYDPEGVKVATVESWIGEKEEQESDANAQAISAIPDLLDACKMAFGFLEMFPFLLSPSDFYNGQEIAQGYANTLRKNLQSAIAKTEGQEEPCK